MSNLSYFPLAVMIARAQAAPILAKVAKPAPCTCANRSFPHRPDRLCFQDERTLAEINDEELALFDRAEARAINSGAW